MSRNPRTLLPRRASLSSLKSLSRKSTQACKSLWRELRCLQPFATEKRRQVVDFVRQEHLEADLCRLGLHNGPLDLPRLNEGVGQPVAISEMSSFLGLSISVRRSP